MPSATNGRKILVEARKDPVCAAMLDALADTCHAIGHRVVRWRGPLSGRMPYRRSLPACDLAILFNGVHRVYRPILARLRTWGATTLMVELGWYPQANHYQIDHRGVNASASWAGEPIVVDQNTPLRVRPDGDLLLLLQLDDDTQITEHSPWFSSTEDMIRLVASCSALKVRVRLHPKSPDLPNLRRVVAEVGSDLDRSTSLEDALSRCRAVACVNSSAAVAALDAGLPVLCYGNAVYRHEGAVYCLDADPRATIAATRELARGFSSLSQERIAALVARILSRQWTIEEVPRRLPPVIESLLTATPVVAPSPTLRDRVETPFFWLADLPARLLYRSRLKQRPLPDGLLLRRR